MAFLFRASTLICWFRVIMRDGEGFPARVSAVACGGFVSSSLVLGSPLDSGSSKRVSLSTVLGEDPWGEDLLMRYSFQYSEGPSPTLSKFLPYLQKQFRHAFAVRPGMCLLISCHRGPIVLYKAIRVSISSAAHFS